MPEELLDNQISFEVYMQYKSLSLRIIQHLLRKQWSLGRVFMCGIMATGWILAGAPVQAEKRRPARQPSGRTDTAPWFSSIKNSVKLSDKEVGHTLEGLYDTLSSSSKENEFDIAAGDSMPRIVAVSWTGGEDRSRTVFRSGSSLQAAVNKAARAALEKESGGVAEADWFRLDVVQHVRKFPSFVLQKDKHPSPTLAGIGFPEVTRVAFLPAQLIGVDAIGPERRIRHHRVSRLYLGREDWKSFSRWNRVSSYSKPMKVFLFEVESYFYSPDKGTRFVFRGHFVPSAMTAEDIGESITECSSFLQRVLGEGGASASDLTLWRRPLRGQFRKEDLAGVAFTLSRMTGIGETGRAQAQLKDKLLSRLRGSITEDLPVKDGACIKENHSTSVATNALFLCALLEGDKPDKESVQTARKIGQYVLSEQGKEGYFISERSFPNWKISQLFSVKDSALGAYALVKLYEVTADPVYLEAAQKAAAYLLKEKLSGESLDHVSTSPWLARTLDALYTHLPDKEVLAKQVRRLASGVGINQKRGAELFDMLGSHRGKPSVTLVAKDASAIAAAVRLLKDSRWGGSLDSLSRTLQYSTRFLRQEQIQPASAMFTEKPRAYLGGFRENCRQVTVSLRAQWMALLAMVETKALLGDMEKEEFGVTEQYKERLRQNRKNMKEFPRLLHAIDLGRKSTEAKRFRRNRK